MAVRSRKIAVFGLGYVGVVSAACLSRDGHVVTGVDQQPGKVALIEEGKSPIVEPFVGELIKESTAAGRLRVTVDPYAAVAVSDISIVCVGTPSRRNGSQDSSSLTRVCEQIGMALRESDHAHIVVIRSTVLPGTMRELVVPALERASGRKLGETLQVAHNPEFLREASAVSDYDNPPKTVVGASDVGTSEEVLELYSQHPGPKIATTMELAELVKYADNAWHALKVGFGNEMGNLAKELCVDSHALMDIFCQDKKLNISPAYLKPGYAFGGSCLPKDLRALTYKGRKLQLELPILNSIMPSNKTQIERAFGFITRQEVSRVAFLGLTYKAGTDDLRESPQVALLVRLIEEGYAVRVHDPNVDLSMLTGANRELLYTAVPEIEQLFDRDVETAIEHADLVVIGNRSREFDAVAGLMRPDQKLLDLERTPGAAERLGAQYEGVNW